MRMKPAAAKLSSPAKLAAAQGARRVRAIKVLRKAEESWARP